MTKIFNKLKGDIGEAIACQFLKKQRYKILQTKYKNAFGEIDIIAKQNNTLIFVEVKSRSSQIFGLPKEAINKSKHKTILAVATAYLKQNKLIDKISVRFDCIQIIGDKNDYNLEHLTNIF